MWLSMVVKEGQRKDSRHTKLVPKKVAASRWFARKLQICPGGLLESYRLVKVVTKQLQICHGSFQ